MSDPRDLCTLADVKTLMQKSGSGANAQDGLIATEITRASVKIMRDYGREFVPGGIRSLPAVDAMRTFEYSWGEQYPGEAFVDLRPYDMQGNPTLVQVDTDQASPVTLSMDEWRMWPKPPTDGVYSAIKVLPLNASFGIVPWQKRELQVTGTWGFPEIPEDVTQACAEMVIHWITSAPAARRVEQVDAAMMVSTPRTYPMSAIDLLGSFKRMTV